MLIDYFKKRELFGLIYSIDFFTFEFMLNLPETMWEQFEKTITEMGQKARKYRAYSGTKKKGKYHRYRAYECGGLHVQFYEEAQVIQLDYNPNNVHTSSDKAPEAVLMYILDYVRKSASVTGIRVRRIDYALDVPKKYSELYVYSRKAESHVRSTRYYGDAKGSGRLRVYDKATEQREKLGYDIGTELTRCEWIQRNEKPFKFDAIGTFDFSGLSGAVSLIQLVPAEFFNEALRRLAQNTRKKVLAGMDKLDIQTEAFKELLHEYYDLYGIPEIRTACLENRLDEIDFDGIIGEEE